MYTMGDTGRRDGYMFSPINGEGLDEERIASSPASACAIFTFQAKTWKNNKLSRFSIPGTIVASLRHLLPL